MRFLLTLFLLLPLTVDATTYTEFYVQTTGSNLNSGHTTDDAATYTGTGGNWTNNTSATTGTWYKSGESLAAVTNGAWAALYTDGTTTNAQYIGLITAVSDANDTITISLNAFMGANPSTVVAGMSIKVGGAWQGPNTNVTSVNGGLFPLNTFVANSATNNGSSYPRVNFKAGTYSVTNAITQGNAGPIRWEGYTSSPGDGGVAILDGGTTVAGYTLLTTSGTQNEWVNLCFRNNGGSGAGNLVTASGNQQRFEKCIFANGRGSGINASGIVYAFSCEATNNCLNGTAGTAGFGGLWYGIFLNSHDNALNGFMLPSGGGSYWFCIARKNNRSAFLSQGTASSPIMFYGCNAYSNALNGFEFTGAGASSVHVINSCMFRNVGMGITNSQPAQLRNGVILNCSFGTGTMTNLCGNVSGNMPFVSEIGSVLYAADSTPWTDPDNGSFNLLAGSAVRTKAYATFLQTTASTNTLSYPDIGAVQMPSTNATTTTSGGSYTFSQ